MVRVRCLHFEWLQWLQYLEHRNVTIAQNAKTRWNLRTDTETVSTDTSLFLGIVGHRVAVRVPGGGGGVNVFAERGIDPVICIPILFDGQKIADSIPT